jgi:hypothetical protein
MKILIIVEPCDKVQAVTVPGIDVYYARVDRSRSYWWHDFSGMQFHAVIGLEKVPSIAQDYLSARVRAAIV